MTDDEPELKPEKNGRLRRGGLFVNDTEICERLNIPEQEGRRVIKALDDDKRSGFPPKQALFGGRRYWPAVREFFDRAYGMPAKPQAQAWVRPVVPQRRTA